MTTITLNHTSYPTLAWNMGGGYTENGQRVAAIGLPQGSYFVDLDRGLDYFFPEVPLDRRAIQNAYLHNRGTHILLDGVVDYWQLRALLEGLAREVSGV